jgi:hypothetical protein
VKSPDFGKLGAVENRLKFDAVIAAAVDSARRDDPAKV